VTQIVIIVAITATLLTPVWITRWFAFTIGEEAYEIPDVPRFFVRYEVGDEVIVRYPDDFSWEKAEIESRA
jgi:hypothetical protein